MTISVRYWSWFGELAGSDFEEYELAAGSSLGDLMERIRLRCRLMWAEGVVAETAALRDRLLAEGTDPEAAPAARTLGIDAIMRGLASGELKPDDRPPVDAPLPRRMAPYVEAMEGRTRRYAKRQLTWLTKYARSARWLDASALGDEGLRETALDDLEAWFRRHPEM